MRRGRAFRDILAASGSEAAREILAHGWGATALGPLDGWSGALRSTLATLLASPTPMVLAWGPELLCFPNDAYRPVHGDRASAGALGRPLPDVWSVAWREIAPLVDAALAGQGVARTDMRLDLARHGVPEDSWWTFSASPVFDGRAVVGIVCVTTETTGRVLAERARDDADERLQLALSSGGGIGAWTWDVVRDRITADARFALLHGVASEAAAVGAPSADFFAAIHPDDYGRLKLATARALEGAEFREEYRLVDREGIRWVTARGRVQFGASDRPLRFAGVAFDVTDRKRADAALRAAKDERDFIIDLTALQRALPDPDLIMAATAERLGRRLGAGRCGFYRAAGPGRMRFAPGWTDGTLEILVGETAIDRYGGRAREARDAGRALVFSDSRADEAGGLERLAEAGIAAAIVSPVMSDGLWQAGLYVHSAAVRSWTGEEVSLVREVAELTWLAVERAEALLRLQGLVSRQDETIVRAASDLAAETAGRNAAESQVRQLQKMEAVGQLTGGIAHDFNNMLAVIIGSLNLMQVRLARGDVALGRFVEAAMDGATRAAALTQRLLAFSRQQPLAPEPVDMNALVAGLRDLLGRTLGETVRLETVLTEDQWRAEADPNQLENAVLNLAVNARDAMPDGGRLTIAVDGVHVGAAAARENEIAEGDYVLVSVTDTGTGMTPAVMARVFDPFFTTKGVGKGTGLGLSQVFGFARQSGGAVRVHSEPGRGSTFRLYLPRFRGEGREPAPKRAPGEVRGGTPDEVVLVVEDEARVRANTVEALRELGYTVLHASDGSEALAAIEGGREVTLLLTDIVMPGMTGRQLADRALELRPGLKVLYTTGYARDAVAQDGTLAPGTRFLAKPFGLDGLALKVREALDG